MNKTTNQKKEQNRKTKQEKRGKEKLRREERGKEEMKGKEWQILGDPSSFSGCITKWCDVIGSFCLPEIRVSLYFMCILSVCNWYLDLPPLYCSFSFCSLHSFHFYYYFFCFRNVLFSLYIVKHWCVGLYYCSSWFSYNFYI